MNPPHWPIELGYVISVIVVCQNLMKMAPVLHAFAAHQPIIPALLVHTDLSSWLMYRNKSVING